MYKILMKELMTETGLSERQLLNLIFTLKDSDVRIHHTAAYVYDLEQDKKMLVSSLYGSTYASIASKYKMTPSKVATHIDNTLRAVRGIIRSRASHGEDNEVTPLEEIRPALSSRAINALHRYGMNSLRDVANFCLRNEGRLTSIRDIGVVSRDEICSSCIRIYGECLYAKSKETGHPACVYLSDAERNAYVKGTEDALRYACIRLANSMKISINKARTMLTDTEGEYE